jgi:hypothetical protein
LAVVLLRFYFSSDDGHAEERALNADEGETLSIGTEKLLQAAIKLRQQPSTAWKPEP